jgi:hypothetical protein
MTHDLETQKFLDAVSAILVHDKVGLNLSALKSALVTFRCKKTLDVPVAKRREFLTLLGTDPDQRAEPDTSGMDGLEAYRRGKLFRYHGNPELNWTGQSNADHTWGVVTLVLFFSEAPSRNLLIAAQCHDIGEEFDAPGPFKRANPEFARMLEVIEHKSRIKIMGFDPSEELTGEELALLDFCDKLEPVLYVSTRNPSVLEGFGWPEQIEHLRDTANFLGLTAKLNRLVGGDNG